MGLLKELFKLLSLSFANSFVQRKNQARIKKAARVGGSNNIFPGGEIGKIRRCEIPS